MVLLLLFTVLLVRLYSRVMLLSIWHNLKNFTTNEESIEIYIDDSCRCYGRLVGAGLGFAAQFEAIMHYDPNMVMITGWNEWTAGLDHTSSGYDTFAGSTDLGFQFVDAADWIFFKMDGTVDLLLQCGKEAGIQRFVVLPVAINPGKTRHINDFILQQAAEHDDFIGFGP